MEGGFPPSVPLLFLLDLLLLRDRFTVSDRTGWGSMRDVGERLPKWRRSLPS